MNMEKESKTDIEELKKEIVIERLRQSPPTLKISLGSSEGKFLDRDELIQEVKNDTEIGNKIINIQIGYLRAFKKGLFSQD